MSKHILSLLALAILSSTAQASYTVKIPLEVDQGGALANNSINFVNPNSGNGNGGNGGGSTEPTDPTDPETPTESPTARKLASQSYVIGMSQQGDLSSGYNQPTYIQFTQMYNSMVAVVQNREGLNEVAEMRSGVYKCPVYSNFLMENEGIEYIAFECSTNLIPKDTPLGTTFTIDFWTK